MTTSGKLKFQIKEEFVAAGKGGHWLYKEYRNLLDKGELVRFQICDWDWFKGAAQIIELVDELHTNLTPKEDFVQLAAMLQMEIPLNISKKELVKMVKSHPNWKVKAFEMDLQRRVFQTSFPRNKTSHQF